MVLAGELKYRQREVLNRVEFDREPVIVMRHDRESAVLLNMDEWRRLTRIAELVELKQPAA